MERARINGVEMAYALKGNGAPLVMIHGAQGDQTMFADLSAAFVTSFRVLTFDQRGSGLSEKPDFDYSMPMLADDTAGLMEHVGLGAAHVIGVSMGGMIAQELAIRHPRKVRSLVLGCTSAGGARAIRDDGNAFAGAYSLTPMPPEERGRLLAQAVFSKGHLERHPEIIAARIEARRNRPLDTAALSHRMAALETHDTYDRLPQIACPTLVITGRDDALIPWQNSRLIAERIPVAQLEVLDPAGHCFWLERPEDSRAGIMQFLETV
ncbi:MAG TPA: alpha/beta fold hydrolase [Patescibacteria group bacterium]|nr:alpha/beta fold hydrolase [Patescibacteria group bacterium]